ncbi:beta-glucosidase [Agromyces terreus]|uniref:Beta-glucosidase n=1 Tax=Agromyces terreus TaxID=424795 RepID=A0A9X2H8A4_9MICO|nr:glycoside hydrolase family 3 protein [Agromyces terreus]MCP2371824.1 beta-glucosidase [Agromyces terreus]
MNGLPSSAAPAEPTGELTLSEAASLLSGADMASTKALPERGIPSVLMTDGSNGLAMNLPDFSGKVPATCFPTSSALAATWDPALVGQVAGAIAREASAAGADVLLSPGMNLKRSPLGGRNFEYYSEDPLLTGELAVGFVEGVQGEGVGACVKHFVANNQETDRMRVSADVSERALRELYLRAFEEVVTRAKPWLVMASYNRVNGTYVSEDERLLTGILREEWGFDGVVVSDWGAVDDRVRALRAGLDLEMPSTSGASDAQVVAAVDAGTLDADVVHRSARRVADLAVRAAASGTHRGESSTTAPSAADLAITAAERSTVLLRNEHGVLPLAPTAGVAVIGAYASAPRFQGGGSAGVQPKQPAGSIVDAVGARHAGTVEYAPGYADDGLTRDPALLEQAVSVAAAADVAIVVVGSPESAESEGYDRADLGLPEAQNELVAAVAAAARSTVVVVISGGPVRTEAWRTSVDAIVSTGLAGQGVSLGLASILVGDADPGGRLAETWPRELADTPSFLSFPGEGGHSAYGEGIFVGYRGHDRTGGEVAFPFGHGLSYGETRFEDLAVSPSASGWSVEVTVVNVSERAAREVVQLYVEAPDHAARRAPRALVGFAAVAVAPGQTTRVRIEVPRRALERWDEAAACWTLDSGAHTIVAARSSRDAVLRHEIDVVGDDLRMPLTADSTLVEWLEHPAVGPALIAAVTEADPSGRTTGMLTNPMAVLMIGGLPIHRLAVDAGNALTLDLLDRVAGSQTD